MPRILPSRSRDLASLPAIELAAEQLFLQAGVGLGDRDASEGPDEAVFEAAHAEGRLWVALLGQAPVGFVRVAEVDGLAHVEELDVHPDAGRRGIGSALLEAACGWGRREGYRAITLTTFRTVPWNGPFYRRRGFRELPGAELGPHLAAILAEEVSRGLTDRCAMLRRV